MLESFGLVVTGVTGFVFGPIVRDILKESVTDLAKDFFKRLPGEMSESILNKWVKPAVGKAFKAFLRQFQEELQARGLDKKQVKRYGKHLQRFLKDKGVRSILGSAFAEEGQSLDTPGLQKIWQDLNLKELPEGFDWEVVGRLYLRKVTEIKRKSDELRQILDSENLDKIAGNTEATAQAIQSIARIIPEFDLEGYRESLRECYGYLKLHVLDSTDEQYRLRLWNLFIPQMVREALPPSRYDLPKEYQRRLRDAGHMEADFSLEDGERYRQSYLQKPARDVLELLQDRDYPYAVILGDPGSGKSTLLQYLALQWAEAPTPDLPLLVELRDYVKDHSQPKSFLEFFHQGTRSIQHLNQQQLHAQLKSGRALVLFDGLDEVFDPDRRQAAITEIIRFTNEYPDVRVVVTSRIIGYNPERLRDAEFRHLTLQDFDEKKIQEFIQKWHEFALGNDSDREMLERRLQTAIDESQALTELAGNPLLLTMMAILNRRQELPRDRAELYDQASRVLLYAWDVDHKRLQLPLGTIGRQEKQGMLRKIAYQMQAGEQGIQGNIIEREKLLEIVTQFLQERGFEQPRDKAIIILDQLRVRNFILCFLGNDYYSFVHRTFLEYFCAWEFVERFEKQRTLTEEELKTEVFGQHWRDESWHEVLRLICGMVTERVAAQMIEYLMDQDGEEDDFMNLFFAAECLSETKNRFNIKATAAKLVDSLKGLISYGYAKDTIGIRPGYKEEQIRKIRTQAVSAIPRVWKDDPQTLPWLKSSIQSDRDPSVRSTAVTLLAQHYKDDPETLTLLKQRAMEDKHERIRGAAVRALAQHYKDDPETLLLIQEPAMEDKHEYVRSAGVRALAQHYKDNPETLPLIKQRALEDKHEWVRSAAVEGLAEYYIDDLETFPLLQEYALKDEHEWVRSEAVRALAEYYKDNPQILPLLQKYALYDEHEDVRAAAVEGLTESYKDDPQTLLLLQEHALSDEDAWVQYTVVRVLTENYKYHPQTLPFLQQLALSDGDEWVRRTTVNAIAEHYKDDPETLSWLRERALEDEDSDVRSVAVKAIAEHYKKHPETLLMLQKLTMPDEHSDVRQAVMYALAKNYKDDPETLPWLQQRALEDEHEDVRETAVEVLAEHYKDDPETLPWLQQRALEDEHEDVRSAVVKAIAKYYPDDPQTLPWLQQRALEDEHEDIRSAAVYESARNYANHPETLPWLQQRALSHQDENVRSAAVSALAQHYKDDAETLSWLQKRALKDEHEKVRRSAVYAITRHDQDDPETLPLLKQSALEDQHEKVRSAAVEMLARYYPDDAENLPLLKSHALSDEDADVREVVVKALGQHWSHEPGIFELLCNCAINDPFERKYSLEDNPRQIALSALLKHHPHNPRTLELLRDRAQNDPDKKLRKFAQKRLHYWEKGVVKTR